MSRMDDDLLQLANTIRSTKCNVCNLVVSVAPVMIISENEQHRCGRCNALKSATFTRNVFYESIAMYVKFPCIYANCKEDIPWGEVENHEKVCPSRTIPCPVYYHGNCQAVLEVAELRAHFEEKHGRNIQHGCRNFTMRVNNCVVFLLIVDEVQYFVYILTSDDQHFSTLVFSLQPTDTFSKYDVTLSSNNNTNRSVSYHNQKIISFNEREHCYKCWKNVCHVRYHPNSQVYPHNTKKLDLICLGSKFEIKPTLQVLENPQEITYTINLVSDELERTKGSTEQPQKVKNTLSDKHGEELATKYFMRCNNYNLFRQKLECPICEEYMLPPMYMCKTGHTVCNVCKSKLPNCPYCEENISEVRNYALEDLAENIELSCQCEKQGCTFIGNIERLREHEVNCPLKIES